MRSNTELWRWRTPKGFLAIGSQLATPGPDVAISPTDSHIETSGQAKSGVFVAKSHYFDAMLHAKQTKPT